MQRFFPGDYRVIAAGRRRRRRRSARADRAACAIALDRRRGARRRAARSCARCARLPAGARLAGDRLVAPRDAAPPAPLRAALRERVRFARPRRRDEARAARARRRRRRRLRRRRARAGRARARARRRRGAGRRAAAGLRGGASATASAGCCSSRATSTRSRRSSRGSSPSRRCASGCRPPPARCASGSSGRASPTSSRTSTASSRRAATTGAATARCARSVAERRRIDVDLHMHTDHSPDCATPVEVLLATARAQGLGAIAVTDHNEISGALEAPAKAEYGVKVIVGEEVKTADQGEVIGLFLEEQIPRGLTLQETIAEINRQGGARLRPPPVRPHARGARLRAPARRARRRRRDRGLQPARGDPAFNEEAARFAAKYRIPAGAGSDAHVAAGARLGADPDARLRRAGGVPGVAARGRHRAQAGEPALRAGAEVPADEGDPAGARGPPPRSAACGERRASPDARAGTCRRARPNLPASMPATDDEIREKYLERAIRELNHFTRELQACGHCPRGNLMPVLGSGHPQADIFLLKHARAPVRDRGGRRLLRARRRRADEVAQAPAASTRSPSTGRCA